MCEKKVNIIKDFLSLMTLFIMGWKFTYNIETTLVGIKVADEGYYLANGISLVKNGLPSLEWAPFYSIWYYFLSFFRSEPLSIFQLSYKIIFISLPILFYLFLRKYKVHTFISLLMASFVLLANINSMHIKVTNFALIFIFTFLIFGSFIKQTYNYLLFISFTSLFVSYIRPEFFLSAVLFFAFSSLLYLPSLNEFLPPPTKF